MVSLCSCWPFLFRRHKLSQSCQQVATGQPLVALPQGRPGCSHPRRPAQPTGSCGWTRCHLVRPGQTEQVSAKPTRIHLPGLTCAPENSQAISQKVVGGIMGERALICQPCKQPLMQRLEPQHRSFARPSGSSWNRKELGGRGSWHRGSLG